ncbi:hypothetical protein BB560_002052 [Smittium megazygosporum]|uniref:Myb-like domain-containing protein n=1 Tax=Smittium megazygosporum TaxID=133381 RepID=A0A2T9ZFX8_9FUNG|nr:hypothetical protein BB560_002052 [Smittium megazygosporum]
MYSIRTSVKCPPSIYSRYSAKKCIAESLFLSKGTLDHFISRNRSSSSRSFQFQNLPKLKTERKPTKEKTISSLNRETLRSETYQKQFEENITVNNKDLFDVIKIPSISLNLSGVYSSNKDNLQGTEDKYHSFVQRFRSITRFYAQNYKNTNSPEFNKTKLSVLSLVMTQMIQSLGRIDIFLLAEVFHCSYQTIIMNIEKLELEDGIPKSDQKQPESIAIRANNNADNLVKPSKVPKRSEPTNTSESVKQIEPTKASASVDRFESKKISEPVERLEATRSSKTHKIYPDKTPKSEMDELPDNTVVAEALSKLINSPILGSSVFRKGWSKEELDIIINHVIENKSNLIDIKELQKKIKRSAGAIMKKTYSPHSFIACNTGKWSKDEDEKLKNYVSVHGPKNWPQASRLIKTRNPFQCLNRWIDLNKKKNYREQLKAYYEFGILMEKSKSIPDKLQTQSNLSNLVNNSIESEYLQVDNSDIRDSAVIDSEVTTENGDTLYKNKNLSHQLGVGPEILSPQINNMNLGDLEGLISSSTLEEPDELDENRGELLRNPDETQLIYTAKALFPDKFQKKADPQVPSSQKTGTSDYKEQTFSSIISESNQSTGVDSPYTNTQFIKFSDKEVSLLIEMSEVHGRRWSLMLPHFTFPPRSSSDLSKKYSRLVSQMAYSYLDRNIKWSSDEDNLLVTLQRKHIHDWESVSKHFGSVSPDQCRYRWHLLNYLGTHTVVKVKQANRKVGLFPIPNVSGKYGVALRLIKLVNYFKKHDSDNSNEITDPIIKKVKPKISWTNEQSQKLQLLVQEYKLSSSLNKLSWKVLGKHFNGLEGFDFKDKWVNHLAISSDSKKWSDEEYKKIWMWFVTNKNIEKYLIQSGKSSKLFEEQSLVWKDPKPEIKTSFEDNINGFIFDLTILDPNCDISSDSSNLSLLKLDYYRIKWSYDSLASKYGRLKRVLLLLRGSGVNINSEFDDFGNLKLKDEADLYIDLILNINRFNNMFGVVAENILKPSVEK